MSLQGRQPRRSLRLPGRTKHLSAGRQSTCAHAKDEVRVATGHGSSQTAEEKQPVHHKGGGKDAHEAWTHLGNREGAANASSTAGKPRGQAGVPEAWQGKNTTNKGEREHQVSEGKGRGRAWAWEQRWQSKARQRMKSKRRNSKQSQETHSEK